MATAAPEVPALARDRAFEKLYRRYVKDVYLYSLALLRNPADAEDVTQTTFLNAYRAYRRGEHIEKPQNWLIKIAHNAARTRYARASRRVKEVPLDAHLEQLAIPEEDKPDVREVLRALGELPLNQRAALVMRELEGRTYAEIADTLGVSVAAVETLIFRARRTLRVRASDLRSLAAVPLPTSLVQFLGGGGAAALGSGGAVLGGSFLIKAAVALVAGVVATSVGGDRAPRVAAATDPATGSFWLVGSEKQPRVSSHATALFVTVRLPGRTQRIRGVVTTARRAVMPGEETTATVVVAAPAAAPAASNGGSIGLPSPTTTTTAATTAASSAPAAVQTVESSAVATVTSSVPAPPPLPSVQLPATPAPPPLPKLP